MAALVTGRRRSRAMHGRRGTGRRAVAMVVLAGSVVLVAACTSGPAGGSSGPGGTSPTAGSPSAAPSVAAPSGSPAPTPGGSAAAAACRTADLTVRVVIEPGRHAAGSTYYPLVFTNASGGPCVLSGYPGVSLASSSGGSQVGRPASPDGTPAQTVTLAPGGEAHAVLQISNADVFDAKACGPVDAPHWLRVVPPGETTPAFASFTPETKVCTQVGQLGISAISAGSSG